jgi:hypothetical protein
MRTENQRIITSIFCVFQIKINVSIITLTTERHKRIGDHQRCVEHPNIQILRCGGATKEVAVEGNDKTYLSGG